MDEKQGGAPGERSADASSAPHEARLSGGKGWMPSLLEVLRRISAHPPNCTYPSRTSATLVRAACGDAADEIERLRGEIDSLIAGSVPRRVVAEEIKSALVEAWTLTKACERCAGEGQIAVEAGPPFFGAEPDLCPACGGDGREALYADGEEYDVAAGRVLALLGHQYTRTEAEER